MVYQLENELLVFMNINTTQQYSFALPGISKVDFMTINNTNTLIAFSASDSEDNSKGIFLCDLIRESIQHIYTSQCYDLKFDVTQDKLYFNSGNKINVLDLHTGTVCELHRFYRIQYAPISLASNSDGSCLSYNKCKSDKQRLFIYDLMTNTEFDMGISFFEYCWIDNQHIIYSLGDGLILFDIFTKKKEPIIRNAKSLIRQYIKNTGKDHDLSSFGEADLVADSIRRPVFRNKRIYFEVFLTSANKKHIGIYSIAVNKAGLQCHYSSKQGLIRDFSLLNDNETIYIHIVPNELLYETIKAAIIFIKDFRTIDYAGWLPVRGNDLQSSYEIEYSSWFK